MGKQRQTHPFEDNPFVEDFLDYMDSPEGQSTIEAIDIVAPMLEKANLDAKKRKIIWEDGQQLSIPESVQRIHAAHPELAPEKIEGRVVSWIEGGFAPSTYSEKQLEELDRLTDKWIDAHERGAEAAAAAAKKRPRTRHS